MGFLKEKYTREYFLSQDKNGNKLNYGALGGKEFLEGEIFEDISDSLATIKNYEHKNILEIGFGRGESIKYLVQHGIDSYCGVDFSKDAFDLAQEFVVDKMNEEDKKKVHIFCDDALNFLENYKEKLKNNIDIIVILDAIEHIPSDEMRKILEIFNYISKEGTYFIGHTPFYGVDEDYIKQEYKYKKPSPSDLTEETKGMHCNKYTKKRFFKELNDAGFVHVKENRLFIKKRENFFIKLIKKIFKKN